MCSKILFFLKKVKNVCLKKLNQFNGFMTFEMELYGFREVLETFVRFSFKIEKYVKNYFV